MARSQRRALQLRDPRGRRRLHRRDARAARRASTASASSRSPSTGARARPGAIGTRAARGDVVVWTDADMTYPNDGIPGLVDQLDGLGPGRRRPHQRAGHAPPSGCRPSGSSACSPSTCPAHASPTSTRGSARSAARWRCPVPPPAARPASRASRTITLAFLTNGHLVRYVPIDYTPRAGRSKFDWRTRHGPLPAPGRPDDHAVRTAADLHAARRRVPRARRGQGRHRPRRPRPADHRQRRHPHDRRASRSSRSACSPTSSCASRARSTSTSTTSEP